MPQKQRKQGPTGAENTKSTAKTDWTVPLIDPQCSQRGSFLIRKLKSAVRISEGERTAAAGPVELVLKWSDVEALPAASLNLIRFWECFSIEAAAGHARCFRYLQRTGSIVREMRTQAAKRCAALFFAAAPSAAGTARSQKPSEAVSEDHSLEGRADWPPSTPAFWCASFDKSSAE